MPPRTTKPGDFGKVLWVPAFAGMTEFSLTV
jgi:hypothetical protein